MNKEERKIVGLAALGGMLELYDFAIYGMFAVYFAHQFFPSTNTYTAILETYMVFSLGFILRPLGGIIFSHIGDEYGRKNVLVYTILIMGVSSVGIALLPTYATIGLAAPLLLLACRLLQGLAIGGELPTTFVYISESMPNKRILAFGITMTGVFSGYLFAAAINYILTRCFDTSQLNDFAWRIPFALGGLVCFISYKIRKTLRETKEFQEIMNKPRLPLVYLLKNYTPQVGAGAIFSATQQVFSILAIIYMPTYLHSILHINQDAINSMLPVALIVSVVTIGVAGVLFRRALNLSRLMMVSLVVNLLIVPFAYYLIVNQYSFSGYILLMFGHAFIGLMIPLYLTTLFPTNIRLSGVAMSYNLSVATFGGLAPVLVTTLIKQTQAIYLTPVLYILAFIVASIILVAIFSSKNSQVYAD
jgi:MFS family permease